MTILFVALGVLVVGGAMFLIAEWLIGRRRNVQLEGYQEQLRELDKADSRAVERIHENGATS